MNRRFAGLLLAGLLAALVPLFAQETKPAVPKPDPWLPLRRFVGTWEGDSQGEPGKGHSVREYVFVLNNRFLRATNTTRYEPTAKFPDGEKHEDFGLFSYDRAQKKLVLRQFHGEGFVNTYVLESVSEDGSAVSFVTIAIENIPAGWRARETYTFIGDDEFTEKFELAQPGQEFAPYSEARFKRRK